MFLNQLPILFHPPQLNPHQSRPIALGGGIPIWTRRKSKSAREGQNNQPAAAKRHWLIPGVRGLLLRPLGSPCLSCPPTLETQTCRRPGGRSEAVGGASSRTTSGCSCRVLFFLPVTATAALSWRRKRGRGRGRVAGQVRLAYVGLC